MDKIHSTLSRYPHPDLLSKEKRCAILFKTIYCSTISLYSTISSIPVEPLTPKQWYKEYRCSNCKKLLCKGVLIDSEIEIKCKQCNTFNTLVGSALNELICMIPHCPRRVYIDSQKNQQSE